MKKASKSLAINGKTLTLTTGILAEQATSAVLARLGDTMVLSTVVMSHNDTSLDYFPLMVEYVERLYAGGRIKGSKWVKREGRPTDDAILTARLIDRSIRPLFPKELKKDVQVVVTVLSVDGENDPDVLSIIATSAALSTSKIPWNGPVGASRVGFVKDAEGKGEYLINPSTSSGAHFLELEMVVTSAQDKVLMLEAGARDMSEEVAIAGIKQAKSWNQKVVSLIEELVHEVGEEKIAVVKDKAREKIVALVEKFHKDDIYGVIKAGANKEVGGDLDEIVEKVYELESKNGDIQKNKVKEVVDYVFKKTIREIILSEGKRPDGRGEKDIRPITAEVGMLPRTHGSAVFSRGETQVLTVATLGTSSLEQLIESPEGEETKRYMHHYSFPPYSVGETGRIGTPSRREIGHGALAERAITAVIPEESKFPYVVRVVSEVMSSNGSTSMASTCGSTLALMDAGVPIRAPVAGIAIGMMSDGEKYKILSDIMGLEDFSGDMDFKVAGTREGITAIQLDVKIPGLTDQMIEETFTRAREGRLHILEKMLAVIPQSRTDVSQFAPKIKTVQVPVEKIGEVIGSGGKTIRNIIATTGATVDVEDDGIVTIASVSEEAVDRAVKWIETLTKDLQPGEIFEGKVKRIVSFGAFVELVPGKEGLVHVSEMSRDYVDNPQDVVQLGQIVKVRVKEIDDQGRINLSMRFGEDAEEQRPKEDRPRREDRPQHGSGSRRDDRRPFRKGPPRDNFPRRRR